MGTAYKSAGSMFIMSPENYERLGMSIDHHVETGELVYVESGLGKQLLLKSDVENQANKFSEIYPSEKY